MWSSFLTSCLSQGVFTYLLETLGASNVECEDLLSLDPDELRTLRPLYGVIFLFKYPTDKPYTSAEGPQDGTFDHEVAEGGTGGLFFAQQTIQNACGTQALLSVVLNRCAEAGDNDAATTTGDQPIELGDVLGPFRSFAMDLPVAYRGEVLSNSPEIRTAHNALARSAPFHDETRRVTDNPDEAEDVFHFVAYVPWRGRLWELDGLQPAPISHGPLTDGSSGGGSFEDKVVEVLRRRIARYAEAEIRFHLIAVVRDRRAVARELGDDDMLDREQRKRLRWMWDNELRAHNHLAFSAEVLKAVASAKLDPARGGGEDAWKQFVDEGMAAAKKRAREQRRALRLLKGGAAAAGKAGEDDDGEAELMTG